MIFSGLENIIIALSLSLADAVYVDRAEHRSWFAEVLRSGVLVPCPRLKKKPLRFLSDQSRSSIFPIHKAEILEVVLIWVLSL